MTPAQDIVERLRFHGRYASESQDECTARKNAEREEAAATISRLTADNEALRKERDEARAQRDRSQHHTSELLARIHRDGGHYEIEHGTTKAAMAADNIIARMYADPSESRADALAQEVERLNEALAEAGESLDWAARRMKGNCSGSDVNVVMLAAGRTADARAALGDRP